LQGIPADATTILPEDPNPMMAAVVFNKQIKVLIRMEYSCRWIQCTELKLGRQKINVVNVYCQFSLLRDDFVYRIGDILDGLIRKESDSFEGFKCKYAPGLMKMWKCSRN